MKININMNMNSTSGSYQKNTPRKQAFKGYFACPIKELRVQTFDRGKERAPIFRELNEKCGRYFDIFIQSFDGIVKPKSFKPSNGEDASRFYEYGQDNKLFLEDKMLHLLRCPKQFSDEVKELSRHLGINTVNIRENVVGGNCFLGKKTNGDDFVLVGDDALLNGDISKEQLAKSLGVKLENLHVIPQPDYHLDVAIRPLKYPYVLVDNCDLTKKMATNDKQRVYIHKFNRLQKCQLEESEFASPEQVASSLSEQGFKPIFVPGSLGTYRTRLNYMNAIVHQKPDGKLVYITNHSKDAKSFWIGFNMEKLFMDYLKKQCPDVDEVIFINGKGVLAECLSRSYAGIHCLTSERPDFDKWKQML